MRVRRVLTSLFVAGALVIPAVPALAAQAADPNVARTATTSAPAAAAASTDILQRLHTIKGLSVTEQAAPAGYRFFVMTYTQLADHRDPSRGTFQQRLTLLHKDVSRPTVVYTSGYGVSTYPGLSEPARIADANQISMEYRYFAPSRPYQTDWMGEDTIWQAATDEHVIIQAFKKIYKKNWLTTGGSKGGMTVTYHRRFYPADVNGSVPYVAPNDVVDSVDRYNAFLDQVGTKSCRDKLTAVQRYVLGPQLAWFRAKAVSDSKANGYTYTIVGNRNKAIESAVVDVFFAFWQYHGLSECSAIPVPGKATNDQIYAWYEQIESLTTYADQQLDQFVPYYFQAAYQLGSPEPYETHLKDLLKFPGSDVAVTFVPTSIRPTYFDRYAMPDINQWVTHEASTMLYVYGGNDPWGAEPFSCGTGGTARGCYRYFVPGGNHGSNISQLPTAQRTKATQLVLAWAGLSSSDEAAKRAAAAGYRAPATTASKTMVTSQVQRLHGLLP